MHGSVYNTGSVMREDADTMKEKSRGVSVDAPDDGEITGDEEVVTAELTEEGEGTAETSSVTVAFPALYLFCSFSSGR